MARVAASGSVPGREVGPRGDHRRCRVLTGHSQSVSHDDHQGRWDVVVAAAPKGDGPRRRSRRAVPSTAGTAAGQGRWLRRSSKFPGIPRPPRILALSAPDHGGAFVVAAGEGLWRPVVLDHVAVAAHVRGSLDAWRRTDAPDETRYGGARLSLIHISEPTRLGMIS